MDQNAKHSQVMLVSMRLKLGRINAVFMMHMLVGFSVYQQPSGYHGNTNLFVMDFIAATNGTMLSLNIVVVVVVTVAMAMTMAMTMMMVFF